MRCGLPQRLLAVGGDEGIDQAEQLLLGFCRHAFDESEATFEPRADGECCGFAALGADAEQYRRMGFTPNAMKLERRSSGMKEVSL